MAPLSATPSPAGRNAVVLAVSVPMHSPLTSTRLGSWPNSQPPQYSPPITWLRQKPPMMSSATAKATVHRDQRCHTDQPACGRSWRFVDNLAKSARTPKYRVESKKDRVGAKKYRKRLG